MREREQISRRGLTWVLITQTAILAPHLIHAPVWLWVLWLLVTLWRVQIFRGAWRFPSRTIKVVLIAVACFALLVTLRGRFDMQGMVVLLLVGFILKLLEMKKRRDFIALCYLGFFVISTQFLFFSDLLAATYGLICIVLMTTSLLAVNQWLGQQQIGRSLRISSGILLQALPLMLLLFVVIPRMGPLWAVPNSSAAAKTGISDTMAPGDFNQLMTSNELAFRVNFFDANPRLSQLYWRALVFSRFDGRRWSQTHTQLMSSNLRWSASAAQEWLGAADFYGTPLRYEIIMEPSSYPWLFSLSIPRQWSDDAGLAYDLRLQHRRPISHKLQYRVTSHVDYRYQATGLPDWQLSQELSLPSQGNSRTREIARAWLQEEGGNPERLMQRLLAYYRENFTYTLRPPLLGEDSVDEFLWESRAGFCEHFSSSFTFFMRAAGIPARVVVGYQGGDYNARENYWVVRQRDAHAWAEIWLDAKGWVKVDPTAAVAPERIERGIDFSLNAEDSRLLGNAFSRQSRWIYELQMRWDAVNYQWTRWVLNYDNARQEQLLSQWLGGMEPWRLTAFVLGSGALLMLSLSVRLLWRRRRHHDPADQQYLRFSQKLAPLGLARRRGEAPRDHARRVAETRPDLARAARSIAGFYELVHYAGNRNALPDLQRAVHQFKPSSSIN